ncbi:MAG TPA: hypothetical protein VHA52_04110, partial [Candidatus Babeliaceae bacterium]|nr:hypothetical protein [Candidatus Babeliaceae bacterium]
CSRGVLLENGTISMTGSPTDIVSTYMAGSGSCENKRVFSEGRHERDFILHSIEVVSTDDKSGGNVLDENSWLQINTEITVNEHVKQLHLSFVLYGENGEPLFSFSHARENLFLMPGFSRVKCEFPKGFLNVGTFFLALYVIKDLRTTVFVEQNILSFRIHEGQRELGRWMGKEPGFIKPKFKWQVL